MPSCGCQLLVMSIRNDLSDKPAPAQADVVAEEIPARTINWGISLYCNPACTSTG